MIVLVTKPRCHDEEPRKDDARFSGGGNTQIIQCTLQYSRLAVSIVVFVKNTKKTTSSTASREGKHEVEAYNVFKSLPYRGFPTTVDRADYICRTHPT
jgi:hypothetical protein